MSRRGAHRDDERVDDDVLDAPLVRYGGRDAILLLDGDHEVDLNAVRDPFTGELPSAQPTATGGMSDDDDAEVRARVGRRLQALREDRGLSKKALAELAGVSPGALNRAENGDPSTGLALTMRLVRALAAPLSEIADAGAPELSMRSISKIGQAAGAPRELLERLGATAGRRTFVPTLGRGFGWTRDALFAGHPKSAAPEIAVAFKALERTPPRDAPMLALAKTLSDFSAPRHEPPFRGIPDDPRQIRLAVMERAASPVVSLDALLSWAWDAGIVVLPLAKAKDFVAAVWTIDETPVIVIAESRAVAAYWLFDLAHEIGHLALGHVGEAGIVDVEAPEAQGLDDDQEREANAFALALLLGEPDALLADVRTRTKNDAPRLFKFSVRDVAAERHVSPGVLGFAAAHEMSDVPADKDRWGSAQNLAKAEDADGRSRVQREYRARIPLDGIDDIDAALVAAVVTDGS
jgi:Zn-dependent peptidase ImmA (M78 family)/transcriptional regulator with XRE-family HTH domain